MGLIRPVSLISEGETPVSYVADPSPHTPTGWDCLVELKSANYSAYGTVRFTVSFIATSASRNI